MGVEEERNLRDSARRRCSEFSPVHEALNKDGTVAKRGEGLRGGGLEERDEVLHLTDDTHPLAAAAHRRLDDHGEAGFLDKLDGRLGVGDGAISAGDDGDACRAASRAAGRM